MKKFLSVVLILTYINSYFGCTANRMQNIQYTDIEESRPEEALGDMDLHVFTNDSSRIIFRSDKYQFMDTMVEGTGSYYDIISISLHTKREMKISEPKHLQISYNNIVLTTQGEQNLCIIKTDSTELFFGNRNYIFNRDTLIGLGQVIYHDHRREKLNMGVPINRQIALADIAGINTALSATKTDETIATYVAGIIIFAGVVALIYAFVNFFQQDW